MTKQPAVYRTPRDPGFVGGYNWTAMLAGLLLLVLVNFAATQFIVSAMPVRQTLAFAFRC